MERNLFSGESNRILNKLCEELLIAASLAVIGIQSNRKKFPLSGFLTVDRIPLVFKSYYLLKIKKNILALQFVNLFFLVRHN